MLNAKNPPYSLIQSGYEEMFRLDIVIAPWLTMGERRERLQDYQQRQLEHFAMDLSLLYPEREILWFDSSVSQTYRERAYYETLLSTAAYLSHLRLGTLAVTDEMISVSCKLIESFLSRGNASILLSIHSQIMMYLNGQVLDYFGGVPESEFVSGLWHRPWTTDSLEAELEEGLSYGLFSREVRDGTSIITLTETGKGLYLACKQTLDACGHLKMREQLIRVANFTDMNDYESMVYVMDPGVHENRRLLIRKSQVQNGMSVLELGCGAGALTFVDGLFQAVGSSGKLIATDPSIGMLARARERRELYKASNVEFVQTGAEKTPFQDSTFDAVIGMLFLHFTDIPRALQEINRVTKPGGTFTTLVSLDFPKQVDFFLHWFAPVFERGLANRAPSVMPKEELLPSIAGEYFTDFECKAEEFSLDLSNVENVVNLIVGAGALAELSELPWKARYDLFDELIRRGYDVKGKFGAENMKLPQKGQWFHGIVKK